MINTAQLPTYVMKALIERGHSTERIAQMDPREAFIEFCEWHGLIHWGDTLWCTVEDLKKAGE